jgi:hypothetical protein
VVVIASVFKKPEFHREPFIDGSIEDVEEGWSSLGFVNNVDAHSRANAQARAVDITVPVATAIATAKNNNNNNISPYGNVAASSTGLNRQVPNSATTSHINVMKSDHSTHPNAN